jgi:hypothetical protein
MHLIIVLRLLVGENEIQRHLIGLVHDGPRELPTILPTWNWSTPGMGLRYWLAPAMSFSAALGCAGSVQKMTI